MATGLIGAFQIAGRDNNAKPTVTVIEHTRKQTTDGFETRGTVLVNGGTLRQTLEVISLGEQTVVYADRVTALTNVMVQSEEGMPLGIENDSLTGGARSVSGQDGRTTFDWQKPQPPVAIPGSWANVDGRLGLVAPSGSGITYAQAHDYSRGIAVYTDILYGSHASQPRQFKAGEEVARRVGVFFLEVTPEETAALAKSCRLETTPGGQVLHFKQPDGKAAEVPLL
jgi:hypothetical protein